VSAMVEVVIDTNIVLDLFVFEDPASAALHERIKSGALRWIATIAMRDELQRVLSYPQIAPRLAARSINSELVLARFDEHVCIAESPLKASMTCGDPDDQKFIDLAAARRCMLLSKDAEVLALGKSMHAIGASVAIALPVDSSYSLIGP
jgi:putative PIN family toxin of toxin-antitoxin system